VSQLQLTVQLYGSELDHAEAYFNQLAETKAALDRARQDVKERLETTQRETQQVERLMEEEREVQRSRGQLREVLRAVDAVPGPTRTRAEIESLERENAAALEKRTMLEQRVEQQSKKLALLLRAVDDLKAELSDG